jgi:ABC-2 type transport system ATP-binding protein
MDAAVVLTIWSDRTITPPMTAISCRDLVRHFGEVQALDGVDLAVAEGEIFGLLGPNGAGKTTTVRLLLGLLEPTRGAVEVFGRDPQRDGQAVRRASGAVLEHGGLYERLTAEENLELWGRIWGLAAARRRARVSTLLRSFELHERRGEPVEQWSRGMKQRLMVARALMHEPPLLLLDEPTQGLDPEAAVLLRTALASLASEGGTTVFLTTHNLAEAERLCTSVGLMRGGRLLACGPPQELARDGAAARRLVIRGRDFDRNVLAAVEQVPDVGTVAGTLERITVALGPRSDVTRITRTIVAAGGAIEGVEEERRTLEQTYLELMRGQVSQ